MMTLKEVKAAEARVKALVKNIKLVDTSKVQLPEGKNEKQNKPKRHTVSV